MERGDDWDVNKEATFLFYGSKIDDIVFFSIGYRTVKLLFSQGCISAYAFLSFVLFLSFADPASSIVY